MKLCTKLTALALKMRPYHVEAHYGRNKIARHYCWTLVEALAGQGIKAYPAASGCAVCFETTPPTYYHPTLGKLK